MNLPESLIDEIRDADYNVSHEDDGYMFSKYSPEDQDFSFYVSSGDNLADFANNIREHYDSFDCSYETYLWLDDSGHGKNGAPYDMMDVYKDMMACHKYILEVYQIVNTYRIDQVKKESKNEKAG